MNINEHLYRRRVLHPTPHECDDPGIEQVWVVHGTAGTEIMCNNIGEKHRKHQVLVHSLFIFIAGVSRGTSYASTLLAREQFLVLVVTPVDLLI